jgi:rare lipoprotein A (peptidoglycan hydrolase)
MSRRRTLSTRKKIALLAGAAAVAGGGAFALAATSNAANVQNASTSTVCQGLATALGNNESFIAAQKAAPDAQSAARIANREAVVAEIKRKQEASGCQVGESVQAGGSGTAQSGGAAQAGGSAQDPQASQAATTAPATTAPANNAGNAGAAAGRQVCNGSTVTLSGEGGAPAASSNQFPAGTTLKVTNLDNNKSTTVKVTSVSGSCVLLNNAAFEQVRQPGKFLIRRALIEKVG